MPEPIEPQLDELRRRARRRLIGAVVLALAAAVVVPMLLESDPKPLGEDVSVKIPPIDDGKFVNKVADQAKVPDTPAAASKAPAVVEAPPARTAPTEPVAVNDSPANPAPGKLLSDAEQRVLAPNAKAATRETTAQAPAPAKTPGAGDAAKTTLPTGGATKSSTETAGSDTKKSPTPATKAAGAAFSVQLGAFADDKGANALAGRLKKAGHPAYTEPYATSRGTVWRVRVGPFPTRDAAEASRSRLKADGQSGIIAAAHS